MFLHETLDQAISAQLREEEKQKQLEHKPSGKLSASMLGEPLQWQILKTLGIGQRVVDDYLLRKFEVGRDTEDWFLRRCGQQVLERQKFVEYRNTVGYVDALVNAEIATLGAVSTQTIPLEVKSTSNAKFKRILQMGQADEMHQLQAGLYALALGTPFYGITYIATDDHRTHTWIFATADIKGKIDDIITAYQTQLAAQTVPVFKERYAWQASLAYNKYPEWMGLTDKEINMALGIHYPSAWEDFDNAQKAKG